MRTWIVGAAGAFLLVAAGAAAGERGSLRAIGEGRGLYLANCAACHGTDARGAVGPSLVELGAEGTFSRLHVANRIEGRRDGIAGERMPCWGTRLQDSWPYGRPAALLTIHKLALYLESAQLDSQRSVAAAAASHK
jgi:mono/diheme cytochrome c family protein